MSLFKEEIPCAGDEGLAAALLGLEAQATPCSSRPPGTLEPSCWVGVPYSTWRLSDENQFSTRQPQPIGLFSTSLRRSVPAFRLQNVDEGSYARTSRFMMGV